MRKAKSVIKQILREKTVVDLQIELQASYQQLAYLWESTGSCPCGARKESPSTHPHVISCPTAKAVLFMKGKE